MAYDAANHRIVMFGGAVPTNNETWAWDGAWTRVITAGAPSARLGHSLAYDSRLRQVVLFGGIDVMPLRDTWVLDGSTWTERHPVHVPLPRTGGSLTWNPARQRVVLIDGYGPYDIPLSDAWEWTGKDWEEVVTPSTPPPRAKAILVPTSRGDGVLLSGGTVGTTPIDDAWVLRWESDLPAEACRDRADSDHDGLVGCADPDCWAICTPACPPGSTDCAASPRCGDQQADPLETCGLCPEDAGSCRVCGNYTCDVDETAASCPGDCP